LTDCNFSRLSQWPIVPIVRTADVGPMLSVTNCLLNKPNVAIWLWTQWFKSSNHGTAWSFAQLLVYGRRQISLG